MVIPRAVIIPLTLVAAVAAYIAFPGRDSVGQTTSAEVSPTRSPTATRTPAPSAPLPAGLTGQLTYRTQGEVVTVQFPGANAISRLYPEPASASVFSSDGGWRHTVACDDRCTIAVTSADDQTNYVLSGGTGPVAWSPAGHTLAYVTGCCDALSADLMLVEDPASGQPRALLHYRPGVQAFAWVTTDELLVALADGAGSRLVRASLDGQLTEVAAMPAAVTHLHPSPDDRTFAFTQAAAGGWRLSTIDTVSGEVRDLGAMGSDPAGVQPPVEVPPEQKGPMYIGWSPDGTKLAFGGGFALPYFMTTVDLRSGNVVRTDFPYGYPGEIKWSADSAKIAVSTYDRDRTRHETYVVDPGTGAARHLLSGCIIIWSPDARYLAVHGEREPGIAIVDVKTGEIGNLTQTATDVPLRWDP